MSTISRPFWTVQEVADLMRVNRKTIVREIEAGNIPSIKVGRQFRIPETWIKDQEIPQAEVSA